MTSTTSCLRPSPSPARPAAPAITRLSCWMMANQVQPAGPEAAQRLLNAVPGTADVVFLEVNVVDPSAFSGILHVHGVEVDGYRVLRVDSSAIPNTITPILLALRDSTGVLPHTYFEWSEGHPIMHLLRYVLLGRGDTGPLVHEILREHDIDPAIRPLVHVV